MIFTISMAVIGNVNRILERLVQHLGPLGELRKKEMLPEDGGRSSLA